MHYVVGVTASADNTTVYYDHWETAGFTSGAAGDEIVPLNKGQVHFFESSNVPGNPRGTAEFYDGGDRIYVAGSLLQLVVSIWPESPGTVFTDAWEVYPLQAWEASYVVPVGENLSATYSDFTKVWALVQSASDGNSITITDPSGPGLSPTLNRGKTAIYEVRGAGTTITGTAPIQVQLMTGRYNSGTASEMRGYTLSPQVYWSDTYVAPVPSWTGGDSDLYLYNPGSATITINYTDRVGSGSFTIPAKSVRSYFQGAGRYVPINSGVYLKSSGGAKFWGIAAGDTGSATWDWGYDLVPIEFLGTESYVSWAPGTSDLSANGSPVYVTALNDNTTVFVDFGPNDGIFDAIYTLSALQAVQVYDPDKDNTGMHIVSTDLVAIAWGESPDVAGAGTPYLDMGYTTLPMPVEWIDVALAIVKTADPTTVQIGDPVTLTLTIDSPVATAANVNVVDRLPVGWEYVSGFATPSEPTSISGTLSSGLELWWNNDWTLQAGSLLTITFRARPTASADATVTWRRSPEPSARRR